MKTRLYEPADYKVIAPWFKAHGSETVPELLLPKCGVVVESQGKPLVAGWLYMDNSVGVCWVSWLVTNPKLPVKQVVPLIVMLIDAASVVAKNLDYGVMFTMTDRPSLGRLLKREGFVANHTGCTQYFKKL